MTADPKDYTVEGRLDLLADKLETLSGTNPGAARLDHTIPAILKRMHDAIGAGAFEAHTLDSHTDVTVPTPADGDFFRYDAALMAWKNATAALPDMTDVTLTGPASGQLLRYDGAQWINAALGLGDLPAITLNDLSDVTIAAPSTAHVLRYNGVNWANSALVLADLPAISFDALSDVVITAPTTDQQVFYNGSNWVNGKIKPHWLNGTFIGSGNPLGTKSLLLNTTVATGDSYKWTEELMDLGPALFNNIIGTPGLNQALVDDGFGVWRPATVILANGTQALTANWPAGAFRISARGFDTSFTTANTAHDSYTSVQTVTNSVTAARTLRGAFIDQNYTFNDGAALFLDTVRGLDIDIDAVRTAAVFDAGIIQSINADVNAGAFALGNPIHSFVSTGTGASIFGGLGVFYVKATHPGASGLIACRTDAIASSAAAPAGAIAAGYQGYAEGANTYTGTLIGVRGFTANSAGAAGEIAILGTPGFLGGGTTAEKRVALGAYAGHIFGNGASLALKSTAGVVTDTLAAVTTGHLNFVTNRGELYVQGASEFDGKVWIDGDLAHTGSGTSIGFFGATPVTRAAAYVQTYSTANRTLSAYTPDNESGAYTGIDNLQIGTVYATVADLNALRVAYENLRAFAEDLAQFVNSIVDDHQAYGLFQ